MYLLQLQLLRLSGVALMRSIQLRLCLVSLLHLQHLLSSGIAHDNLQIKINNIIYRILSKCKTI